MPIPNPFGGAWRSAAAFRPDVVHAHSPFVTGRLAVRLARRSGAPLVFTHHTRFADYGHYLGPLAGPGAAFTDTYLRSFWSRCAAIIAPSSDLAEEIRGRLPRSRRERVHVIPTGVDLEVMEAIEPVDPRSLAGWPADSVVLVTLGRLAPEKSPMTILEATAELAGRRPEVRLLVIGGGPSEDALRERGAAPDLAGRVAFTGALPRPEALARMAGADLFLFASRTETQGLVLAEALAAGVPAVALEGPGVRDSVRDGVDGLVVARGSERGDAAALAHATERLVAEPDARAEMAFRARTDALRFATGRRMTEVEALYGALRGRPG
jgi:glycosyltransferase involved in cell wall biosynthesis